MKRLILLIQLIIFSLSLAFSQGFKVTGTQLIDANGKEFMIRGLAVPLSWFVTNINDNIVNIRNKTNANCLRIVINTTTSNYSWQTCVNKCIANNMIPLVELHDMTCDKTSGGLANMANWWVKNKAFLTKPEIARYILINIANEWGDWDMAKNNPSLWRDAYMNAVSIMRKGGISTTLVIDAPDCGQDLSDGGTLKAYAKDVFNADSLKNCLFSVHLYGEWESSGGSKPANLPTIKNAGIPFIVGEFAASVDDTCVMNVCQRNRIGWLAWSWKGNSDPTTTDMSYDWKGDSITLWGNAAVNGVNGMKQTSHIASVFAGDSGCISSKIEPNIQVNGGDWVQSSFASVKVGDNVVIGPKPATDGSWIWAGPKGFTSATREVTLNNIQSNQGGFYFATYTNADTCKSDTAIKISVVAYEAADTLISGATYKITSKYSGKTFDVTGSSTEDSVMVNLANSIDNATNQEWVIKDLGKSYWGISSVNSSKALSVKANSILIGAYIEQRTYNENTSQKWRLIKDNNGYYQIKNSKSLKCLDINAASIYSGAPLVQYNCSSDDNQKFSFIKIKDPDYSSISSNINTNLVLYPNPANAGKFDVLMDNVVDGTQLQIFDLQGKNVYNMNLTSKNSQVNSNLSPGVYVVKINSNKVNFEQKLVIQ